MLCFKHLLYCNEEGRTDLDLATLRAHYLIPKERFPFSPGPFKRLKSQCGSIKYFRLLKSIFRLVYPTTKCPAYPKSPLHFATAVTYSHIPAGISCAPPPPSVCLQLPLSATREQARRLPGLPFAIPWCWIPAGKERMGKPEGSSSGPSWQGWNMRRFSTSHMIPWLPPRQQP